MKKTIFLSLALISLPLTLFATGNGGNEMMRDDKERQEYFDKYGYDLDYNLDQSYTEGNKCRSMDRNHMGSSTFNDDYSCMKGYENVPQRDVGDEFDQVSEQGPHPAFERRMQD